MNILFICMNPLMFNSSGTVRNIGFIKGALELGHNVDTVTLESDNKSIHYDSSNHELLKITHQYELKQNYFYKKFRSKKRQENLQRIKFKYTIKNLFREGINNILKELLLFDLQVINIKNVKLAKKYDLVISSSDPKSSHLLADYIIKKNKLDCPWYQYWGDPMCEDITYKNNGRIKQYRLRRAEAGLLKKADRIIYTSPLTLQRQKSLYSSNAGKMKCVTQACIKQEKKTEAVHNKAVKIGYFGDYKKAVRDISALISVVEMTDLLELIIAGDGDIHTDNQNIRFYPRLSYENLDKLEQSVDILVGVCNKRGGQIPAKFYYMAGTQKPIILVLDGEYAEYLENYFNKYHRYIVCQNTPELILDAIQTAIQQIQKGTVYSLPEEFLPINVATKILSKEGKDDD